MGSSTIQFNPNNAEFSGQLIFGVTKKVYSAMQKVAEKNMVTATYLLCSISKQFDYFLLSRSSGDGDQPAYKIYSPIGVFTFVEDKEDPDRYTLVNFQKNSLVLQNEAMRYGITVSIPNGVIFQVRLKEQNIFKDIFRGQLYDTDTLEPDLGNQIVFKDILLNKCFDVKKLYRTQATKHQKLTNKTMKHGDSSARLKHQEKWKSSWTQQKTMPNLQASLSRKKQEPQGKFCILTSVRFCRHSRQTESAMNLFLRKRDLTKPSLNREG